jgi:putative membrane protein
MNGFLVRTAVTALGLLLAAVLVPGIRVSGLITLVLAAVLFGVVNAVVRPALLRLTVPFTGAMLLVVLLLVNAAMLGLTALLLPGMQVRGVLAAVLGSLVVSAVGWGASRFVGDDGRIIAHADRRTGTLPPRL